MLIDTHAHMGDSAFDADREEVLKKAHAVGIHAVINISESLADAEHNLTLTKSYPMLLPAAGLAPSFINTEQAEPMITFIRKERNRLWAIGEVGLDYWIAKEEAERDLQREIFSAFIDLAMELDLPLNVHSRATGRHVIDLLIKREVKKVQLHAFDGKASIALPAAEAGFYFSIPPSVVRSQQKQKLVHQLPLSNLLIETDSPVLGPFREQRNEPANALISIAAIAELKNIRKEEVVEAVSQNTRELYGDIKGFQPTL